MSELGISERQTGVLGKELTLLRDTSVMQSSRLEKELTMLRAQLAEKDRKILQFEGMKTKSSFVEEQLKNDLRRKDEEIKRREEDLKRKEKTITQKNEEIRQLISNTISSPDPGDDLNVHNELWEDTSALSNTSDFDLRKFSPGRGKPSICSFVRPENRDDAEARELTVSFSDDIDQRHLPMQIHDSLSKKLEKMYLDG
mmetsp:Transcript_1434/g.2317  ORF Transcript_1434/g.2317 Transcript_1434/m.2317 type:complete len:199 (+) Transcript_1434:3-599(+)